MPSSLQIQHAQHSHKKKLAGAVGIGFLINNMANYDPTHTTVLRNRFVGEMRKRFRELRGVIRKAIVEQDVLGLARPETYALDIPAQKAFDFRLSSEKIDGFMGWLKTQENKGVLEIIESVQVGGAIKEPWTNKYIQSAYKKGLARSRAELRKAGYPVPPDMDSVFGGINAIFQGPTHSDAAGILYSRTYNELKGITNAMDQQISRVLSQGIIDGSGPATMAREINNVIKKQGGTLATKYMRAEQRATILARTEVIRAHNEASLQEFANWEVEGVKTLVEHVGAWDSRMCQECKDIAGMDLGSGPGVFTRSQWRNYFPVHPQCRCTPVPMDVTGKEKKPDAAKGRPLSLDETDELLEKRWKDSPSRLEYYKSVARMDPSAYAGERKKILQRFVGSDKIPPKLIQGTNYIPFDVLDDLSRGGYKYQIKKGIRCSYHDGFNRRIVLEAKAAADKTGHEFSHAVDAMFHGGSEWKAGGYWTDGRFVSKKQGETFRSWFTKQHSGKTGTYKNKDGRFFKDNWLSDYEGRIYDRGGVGQEWWAVNCERYTHYHARMQPGMYEKAVEKAEKLVSKQRSVLETTKKKFAEIKSDWWSKRVNEETAWLEKQKTSLGKIEGISRDEWAARSGWKKVRETYPELSGFIEDNFGGRFWGTS